MVVAIAAAATGLAQQQEPLGPNEMPLMRSLEERWNDRATLIEGFLRDANYKRAESAANSLLGELTKKVTGGPEAGRILAQPILLRAVARVGLKREDDGVWDSQMAAELWPEVALVPLDTYGPAGKRLSELRQAARSELARLATGATGPTESDRADGFQDWTPPRAVKKPEVEFPPALSTAMKSGQAVVDLYIDEEGRGRSPTVRNRAGQNSLFLFSAMEGLRNWRFEPGTHKGIPIVVVYSLTVNYKR